MSTLNVSNITDGTDTVGTGYVVNGSAKAWVAANGSAVIRNSLNVSSGVDNGTGDFSYPLISAYSAEEDYVTTATVRHSTDGLIATRNASRDFANQLAVETSNDAGSLGDYGHEIMSVGDLA